MLKISHHKYLVLFVICLVTFVFQYKLINEFPEYIHSWAQSDRYALALGFIHNGGDFFHPETFVLNPQFPGDFKIPQTTTITSVDFPIHDYMASLIMRVFNSREPWCFRLYTVIYSIIGLFFLYRLTKLFTDSIVKSICVVLFAISSPVYLYYQAGFLPTVPSLANCVISLFFFFRYLKLNRRKDFALSLVFITLATLARLPFAIVLVAMMCLEFLMTIKTKKIDFLKWLYFLIPIGFVLSYYVYNNYLRNHYGSMFLNNIMPAPSWSELLDYIGSVYERWSTSYFTVIHYVFMLLLLLLFLYNVFTKKIKWLVLDSQFILFTGILLSGCVIYYVLMAFQFLHHDYYFLDTFYIPILFLFIYLLVKASRFSNLLFQKCFTILSLVVFIPALLLANITQINRREKLFSFNKKSTAQNFEGAEQFLNNLKIPKDSKILVLGGDGPNNPFILMNRKGYSVLFPDAEKIEMALKWPYDFVVLENSEMFNSVYNQYPDIVNRLTKLSTNGNITIYSKNEQNVKEDLESFLNLSSKEKKYHQRISFDTIPENCSNVDSLSSFAYSGKKAGFVNSKNEYGFTYKIFNQKYLNTSGGELVVKAMFATQNIPMNDLILCVSVKSADKDMLFLTFDIGKKITDTQWRKQEFVYSLPQIEEKEFEIGIFIWNKGKNKVFYDDFDITIY